MIRTHSAPFAALLFLAVGAACTSACSSSSSSSPAAHGPSDAGSSSGDAPESQSTDGSSESGATSLPPQCTALATAACKQLAQCDPLDMEQDFGGDMSTCVAQMVFACPSVTEPGTSNTPSSIEACANALGQLASCDDYWVYINRNAGSLCPTAPGALADGASCLDDSECKGGYCGPPPMDGGASSSNCGACAEEPGTTACQENSNCPTGKTCNGTSQCVTAGGVGAPCDDSNPFFAVQPCFPYLYCKFAAGAADGGTASGTCATLETAGQPCNPNDDANDCADGLFCNGQATCAAVQFVAIGATCDGVGLVCKGAYCAFSADASATATTGVCTGYVANGAPCQMDGQCLLNANCVNGQCSTAAQGCN